MSDLHWFVVGSLSGLRVEQHRWTPDTALAGPYATADIAVTAMQGMLRRDRRERLLAYALAAVGAVVVAGIVWRNVV